ncbi:MAG: hydroxyethylthiazole kinase [Geminicoccaceae bacterium]
MTNAAAVWASLRKVRETRPLVHNITNFVAMDLSANALLALGAAPAMIHAVEEAAEFARISSAVVINIGTLSPAWVTGMRSAATAAREARRPWVLDPVGCGATGYRTGVARDLAALAPTLIRGNASEIMALAGASAGRTRGVDSTDSSDAARAIAVEVASDYGCIVGVTGEIDYVTDGNRTLAVHGSDAMLTRVTATGCALSAVCGAFLAAVPDPLTATAHAFAAFGAAGARAARAADGPGSLRVRLLDELYRLDEAALEAEVRIA